MRVLFWGTPEFATAPLRALIGEGFDVVGVVTQPDKPVGRSRSTLQASPVKKVALAEGIPGAAAGKAARRRVHRAKWLPYRPTSAWSSRTDTSCPRS